MKEVWRPIKDFEGLYEVSNLGRVKSVLYRDKECTELYADDPWYRHRTNKLACYNGYWYQLIVLNIKRDPKVELEKYRNQLNR